MERERVRMLLCRSVRYTTAKWSSRNRHEAWGVFANKSAQFSPPRSALALLQIRATKSTHVSALSSFNAASERTAAGILKKGEELSLHIHLRWQRGTARRHGKTDPNAPTTDKVQRTQNLSMTNSNILQEQLVSFWVGCGGGDVRGLETIGDASGGSGGSMWGQVA